MRRIYLLAAAACITGLLPSMGLPMTLRSLAALAAGIVFGFVTSQASADLIVGTFSGKIYGSYDETNVFGAGTGSNTVLDQAVTGAFSYKVSDVPSDQCGGGYGCYYSIDGSDWLDLSVTFNGVNFTIPKTGGYHVQGLDNRDISVVGYDFFRVRESDYQFITVGDNSIYHDDYLYAKFLDYIDEHVPGSVIPTDFSFTLGSPGGADGYLHLFNSVYDSVLGGYTEYNYAVAGWTLSSISARSVNVPEPTSIALFAAGLTGLALMNRRRKTK